MPAKRLLLQDLASRLSELDLEETAASAKLFGEELRSLIARISAKEGRRPSRPRADSAHLGILANFAANDADEALRFASASPAARDELTAKLMKFSYYVGRLSGRFETRRGRPLGQRHLQSSLTRAHGDYSRSSTAVKMSFSNWLVENSPRYGLPKRKASTWANRVSEWKNR